MSFFDLQNQSPLVIVTEYLSQKKGKGIFLSREEVDTVAVWLKKSKFNEKMLLDAIDQAQNQLSSQKKSWKFSIGKLNPLVLKKLEDSIGV